MSRAQYMALWAIGAVAVIAYLQSYQVARQLRASGIVRPRTLTA